MTTYQRKMHLDWDDIEIAVEDLSKQLITDARFGNVRALIGIARGGLIVATLLSHKLWPNQAELPIGALNLQSYDNHYASHVKPYGRDPYDWDLPVLIIDDLVDEGHTMLAAKSTYPKNLSAVIVSKPAGAHVVDYNARAVPQDTWIVFPWESE